MVLPATLCDAAVADVAAGWRPVLRLGAESPGGLALPAARATRTQMYAPRGVWLDDERLAVCDSGNHRVLVWDGLPAEDGAPADAVLGQASFDGEGPAATGRGPGNGVHLPTGVIVANGRLLVADAWHHRVLVWNRFPESSDSPPDRCLGQASLADVAPNRGGVVSADSLRWPSGLAVIAGRLHVADTGNRRVLVWNGLPDHDAPADIVLGQADLHAGAENRGGPVGPASFRWPHGIAGDGSRLFVADAGDHRVLGWVGGIDGDRPADVVLGQRDFHSAVEMPHVPQGPDRLRFPYAVAACENLVAVADTANNRVLAWELPFTGPCGPRATTVIGQRDFAAGGENRWEAVMPDTFCWPYGLCLHRGRDGVLRLAVADSGNNRVTVWEREI